MGTTKLMIKPLPDKITKYELIGRIEEIINSRFKQHASSIMRQAAVFCVLDFLNTNKLIDYNLYCEVFKYYQTKYDGIND